jgi:hypothetical protein
VVHRRAWTGACTGELHLQQGASHPNIYQVNPNPSSCISRSDSDGHSQGSAADTVGFGRFEHKSGCSRSSLVSVPMCSILGNLQVCCLLFLTRFAQVSNPIFVREFVGCFLSPLSTFGIPCQNRGSQPPGEHCSI